LEEARVREVAAKLPVAPPNEIEASTHAMIKDLNRFGLTAFGSAGCENGPCSHSIGDWPTRGN